MTTLVIVDRKRIELNRTRPAEMHQPVMKVKTNRGMVYAREVIIHGPSRVCYDPEGKKCGVSAWVETDAEVELIE